MPGYNSNYGGATLQIDVSEVAEAIELVRKTVSDAQFHQILRRTFTDAGKKVKTILRKEVPQDYEVTASWVGGHVGWPKIEGEGARIRAVVPVKGTRGSIGGRFKVTGARGRPARGRRYKISAKILKGIRSTMPDRLPHQGGNPPFMWNGVAFTRKYPNKAKPIVHVVGLGVPQMPINKSKEDVQDEIVKVVEKRLQHHWEYALRR